MKIPLFKVYMSPDVDKPLLETLHSGYIGQGEKVKEFEQVLGKRLRNDDRCLTLSAGTHGLHLALRLAGVSNGDEVITTALTCTATNWPILMQGAKPVWADINSTDLNISPIDIEKKITRRTAAILVMHWGGYPCQMQQINYVAQQHGLPVIEDAAHAFGATYYDTVIGDCTYSDYTMFSFQAIKTLTSVDGGALLFNPELEEEYSRGKLMRWYGINRESLRRDLRCEDDILEWGYKYHMNDINATIGLENLKHVDTILAKAKENVDYYIHALSGLSGITIVQHYDPRIKSANWLFTVLVEDRTGFARMMGEKGVHVSRVHERNDKHPCVVDFMLDLPGLESVINDMICIPCGWWVTKEDREYIVDAIKGGW